MLLLPYLAILMVASLGHVYSEETIPIQLLADFARDTGILGLVKTFCDVHGKTATKVKPTEINLLFCEPVNELDKQFKDFGEKILAYMNMNIRDLKGNKKKHSVFAALIHKTKVHNKFKQLLKEPTKMTNLITDYHEFVKAVVTQINVPMTKPDGLPQLNAKFLDEEEKRQIDAKMVEKIEKIFGYEEAETEIKLKLLKELFLEKVKFLGKSGSHGSEKHPRWYSIHIVATVIGINMKYQIAEKRLKFSLAFFVANLIYIEKTPYSGMHISDKWKEYMTIQSLEILSTNDYWRK